MKIHKQLFLVVFFTVFSHLNFASDIASKGYVMLQPLDVSRGYQRVDFDAFVAFVFGTGENKQKRQLQLLKPQPKPELQLGCTEHSSRNDLESDQLRELLNIEREAKRTKTRIMQLKMVGHKKHT